MTKASGNFCPLIIGLCNCHRFVTLQEGAETLPFRKRSSPKRRISFRWLARSAYLDLDAMVNIVIRMGTSQMNGRGDQMLPLLRVRGWRQRQNGDNRALNIKILTLHKCLQQKDISPRTQTSEFMIHPLRVLSTCLRIIKDDGSPCPIECSGGASLFTVRSMFQILKNRFLYSPVATGP